MHGRCGCGRVVLGRRYVGWLRAVHTGDYPNISTHVPAVVLGRVHTTDSPVPSSCAVRSRRHAYMHMSYTSLPSQRQQTSRCHFDNPGPRRPARRSSGDLRLASSCPLGWPIIKASFDTTLVYPHTMSFSRSLLRQTAAPLVRANRTMVFPVRFFASSGSRRAGHDDHHHHPPANDDTVTHECRLGLEFFAVWAVREGLTVEGKREDIAL